MLNPNPNVVFSYRLSANQSFTSVDNGLGTPGGPYLFLPWTPAGVVTGVRKGKADR